MAQNKLTLADLIAELKEKVLFLGVTAILSHLPPPQASLFESKTEPKSPGSAKRNFRKRVRDILCED